MSRVALLGPTKEDMVQFVHETPKEQLYESLKDLSRSVVREHLNKLN